MKAEKPELCSVYLTDGPRAGTVAENIPIHALGIETAEYDKAQSR